MKVSGVINHKQICHTSWNEKVHYQKEKWEDRLQISKRRNESQGASCALIVEETRLEVEN